ncbi:MAG: hypothetical protein HKN23_11795 [Verrucomicrobiales bacterium]|nr:hypothetical protein [Verrucomicrobiales bacterium]
MDKTSGNPSALKILGWLTVIGIMISGWLWGWKWRQIAAGERFSADEQLIIDLQDQVTRLTGENERLTAEFRKLSKPEPD